MLAVECGSYAGEASTSLHLLIMDSILRQLEGLSRNELVWLSTYLTGRLRALPPTEEQPLGTQPEVPTPAFLGGKGERGNPVTSFSPVAPLPERIEAINYSMDPWECTGAAPQGWATHLQQSLLPIQGYIQLRPHDTTSLPSFGTTAMAPPGGASAKEEAIQDAPRRQGKASKPVSIFARAPVCKESCLYCRARPCDVAVDHDDHTCYDCEQRLLNPDGEPGAPWRPPLLPACDLLCYRSGPTWSSRV